MARHSDTPETRLTYTVCEAGKLMGIGRNQAHEAAHRGDLPTIKIGSRILVPKIALAALLAKACGKAA